MWPTRARTLPAVAVVLLASVFLLNDSDEGLASPAQARPSTRGDGCGQWGYATNGSLQRHPTTWRLNVSSIPPYLDRARAVRAIRRAAGTVARGRTPCPEPDIEPASLPRVVYGGPTTRSANVTPDTDCSLGGNSDGVNVISFGPLPADVVAVACTYTDRGDIWQSDVMLNKAPGMFTLMPHDGSCSGSYDLQAVVTHERGHSFGLAHVSEGSDTDELTMSPMMGRCDSSARSLGSGDVAGLRDLY